MKSVFVPAILGVVVVASAGSALASPLNLTRQDPDVASGFIAVDYDAVSHVFSATGFSQHLSVPSTTLNNRQFLLTATISNSGVASGPASLIVRGDFGGTDQLLFSSNTLTAFGFGTLNKFEFVFTKEAGSIGADGASIGTILVDTGLSFAGGVPSFANSFSGRLFPAGPGAANADTFVIPSPSGLAAFASLGLVARRRRR